MALDEPTAEDKRFDIGGITFLVGHMESGLLGNGKGVRVEYRQDDSGEGFAIEMVEGKPASCEGC
ncbi:MAG: hypothetical protein HY903_06350 [Deltaproteobacteria bacterium]|nr:hypothetical protein [Deltaproteobacteria bacterium]